MPFSDFEYAFLNTVPPEKRRGIYERFVVPETGRVFFQAALSLVSAASPARVDFNQARAPLLLVAGGSDHIVPPAINRSNYRKYRRSPAITAFKETPGRSHWINGQDNWQEVAGFIATWLESLGLEEKGFLTLFWIQQPQPDLVLDEKCFLAGLVPHVDAVGRQAVGFDAGMGCGPGLHDRGG